jgi:hypothetical protein
MGAFADWVAGLTARWADFYANSPAAETIVTFLHVGGAVAGGGLAVALDRTVVRPSWRARENLARELHASHVAVVAGLSVVLLSGVAMTAADPTVFLVSWLYWAKMLAVGLLLVNGLLLKRGGERLMARPHDDPVFRAVRAAAIRSAILWTLTILGGIALTTYV